MSIDIIVKNLDEKHVLLSATNNNNEVGNCILTLEKGWLKYVARAYITSRVSGAGIPREIIKKVGQVLEGLANKKRKRFIHREVLSNPRAVERLSRILKDNGYSEKENLGYKAIFEKTYKPKNRFSFFN